MSHSQLLSNYFTRSELDKIVELFITLSTVDDYGLKNACNISLSKAQEIQRCAQDVASKIKNTDTLFA